MTAQVTEVSARAWFVIHTYSGHEDKVKATLEKLTANQNVPNKIFKIMIPTEDVVEIKKNKRTIRKRKFFPGYVLADMVVDNQTYWLVRNTPGVTGFLGGVKPTPLPESEARNMIDLATATPDSKPKAAIQFEQGETVRINEGPFKHFIGTVEDVNEERAKIKVMVSIFGRGTPVELDFLQVEKL
ncbi:MAG: transcription termination/antitermination factor NusG [Elusimicrobia bacterium RIFCSPLOWO2_01_FULL_54_10]|nr:MAG: transcription termination/antitermination factor NusG [Elusimicrobia bacterium RIFCSPLOWO2_01_FULL_54_10]